MPCDSIVEYACQFCPSAAVCCDLQDSESDPKTALRPPGHRIGPVGVSWVCRFCIHIADEQNWASRAQNWARRPDAGLTRCGWASSKILRIRKALNLGWQNLILGSITFQHRWPDLILGSMTFRYRWPDLILGSMTFRHCGQTSF